MTLIDFAETAAQNALFVRTAPDRASQRPRRMVIKARAAWRVCTESAVIPGRDGVP